MTETPDPDRLKKLDGRIARARKAQEPEPPRENVVTDASMAWRMVIELTVGIIVGFGIGFGLDSLLGTIPIFLVLFTLLGFAAGVRTMLRSVQEIQKENAARAEDEAAQRKSTPNGAGTDEGDSGSNRSS